MTGSSLAIHINSAVHGPEDGLCSAVTVFRDEQLSVMDA